eukprot:3400720-Rhodomonas_salina.1
MECHLSPREGPYSKRIRNSTWRQYGACQKLCTAVCTRCSSVGTNRPDLTFKSSTAFQAGAVQREYQKGTKLHTALACSKTWHGAIFLVNKPIVLMLILCTGLYAPRHTPRQFREGEQAATANRPISSHTPHHS